MLLDNRLQGLEDLANGLQELRLIAVTGNGLVVDTLDVLVRVSMILLDLLGN